MLCRGRGSDGCLEGGEPVCHRQALCGAGLGQANCCECKVVGIYKGGSRVCYGKESSISPKLLAENTSCLSPSKETLSVARLSMGVRIGASFVLEIAFHFCSN